MVAPTVSLMGHRLEGTEQQDRHAHLRLEWCEWHEWGLCEMQDLAHFNDQLQRVVVRRWSCIERYILPTSRPYRRWIGIAEEYQPVASYDPL